MAAARGEVLRAFGDPLIDFPPAVPAQRLTVAPDSPVVLLVFDELSTFALLD